MSKKQNIQWRIGATLLIASIMFVGCKNTISPLKSDLAPVSSWIYLNIEVNNNEFRLSTYDDTLILKKAQKNSDFIQKIEIGKNEKDSLFRWAESLVQEKPKPTSFCTDYYGNLTVKIIYDEQVSRQVQYNSICEWQNLDSNTFKIYKLIIKKIRIE